MILVKSVNNWMNFYSILIQREIKLGIKLIDVNQKLI